MLKTGGTLHPPSDVCVRSFLCPFLTLIKLCYTKALEMPGPWSRSSIFFGDHESESIHCNLSSWGLVRDLQDKRTFRALASLLSQYTRFLLYFSNVTVCLCEWMTCPARSKWWALLCGFTVPRNAWREPPKGEPCQGFILTCQCQETPTSLRGEQPEMGEACGPNFPFSVTFSWSLWPLHKCMGN